MEYLKNERRQKNCSRVVGCTENTGKDARCLTRVALRNRVAEKMWLEKANGGQEGPASRNRWVRITEVVVTEAKSVGSPTGGLRPAQSVGRMPYWAGNVPVESGLQIGRLSGWRAVRESQRPVAKGGRSLLAPL